MRIARDLRRWIAVICFLQISIMLPQVFSWSAVWDEPGHLVAGLNHWRYGDFRVYAVNPPLARVWATLPVMLFEQPTVPTLNSGDVPSLRREFELGSRFFDTQGSSAIRSLRIARIANLVWAVAGTWLMWWITRKLFSDIAGIVAAVLWAFCPLVIAHGILLPPDLAVAVAAMFIAIVTAGWIRELTLLGVVRLGTATGFGLLIKSTLLVCLPLVTLLGVAWAIRHRPRQLSRPDSLRNVVLGGLVVGVISLLIVNMGYGWSGSFRRLGSFEFRSLRLSGNEESSRVEWGNVFRESMFGNIPVPLPADFVLGIDAQYRDFEFNFFYPYLLGEWNRDGFPLFYVWYYLLKMPIGLLVLASLGAVMLVTGRNGPHDRELFASLVVVMTGAFVFVSSRTDLNVCQRYSLVSLPLVCVAAASVWCVARNRIEQVAIGLLTLWSASAGVFYASTSLAYYNELAGGVTHGRFMLDGNATDWGQSHFAIGDWCRKHQDRQPLTVATVGNRSNLAIHGINADTVWFETDIVPMSLPSLKANYRLSAGWHIASIHHLLDPRSYYHDLRFREPVEWIGGTHAVFFLDETALELLLERKLRVLPNQVGGSAKLAPAAIEGIGVFMHDGDRVVPGEPNHDREE